jgi:hypothetical protein
LHVKKFVVSELTVQLEGAAVGFGRPRWLKGIVIGVADAGDVFFQQFLLLP